MDLRISRTSWGVLRRTTTTTLVFLFILFELCLGEIHRAIKSRPPMGPTGPSNPSAIHVDDVDSSSVPMTDSFDSSQRFQPWLCSIIASLVIGFSGVLPLFLVPAGATLSAGRDTVPAKTLRLLLSFAVGGLLGDVFLHLLPEAWHHLSLTSRGGRSSCYLTIGLWVLAGIFTFIVIEMMFEKHESNPTDVVYECNSKTSRHNLKNGSLTNGGSCVTSTNGHHRKKDCLEQNGLAVDEKSKRVRSDPCRNVAGYLNLLANSIDNFTHGLAVAGSFLVSFKVGLLTTFAILIHEIPHEIGDFAILLRSGFNRLEAARAQMATAVVGLVGAIAALSAESAQTLGETTLWILPFTAGGFLNIALVNVLPDILQEKDPKESIKQVGCIFAGIVVMALVTIFL